MNRKKKAFTLIELLVVVAIIALLISILLPSLSRARELSKRLVCASNVKGMGTAFKIYANDFEENWPTVPFSKDAYESSGPGLTWYLDANNGAEIGQPSSGGIVCTQGGAEPERECQSDESTVTLTTTRNLWMLVRSGDVTPKSYICPSSGDSQENEQNIDVYYDFKDYDNVSYGFQVPFGPFSIRASEDVDPRLAVAADKGPYAGTGKITTLPEQENNEWDAVNNTDGFTTPLAWRKFNSGNHGGGGAGEGQNVLFGDGHATFEKTPIVGIDKDNIYTKMNDLESVSPTARDITPMASGVIPSQQNQDFARYPGYQSLDDTADASTDSLIYP